MGAGRAEGWTEMNITITRLSTGYWYIRGDGPCEWAQPPTWPCDEATLRAHAFPEASEDFIRAAMRYLLRDEDDMVERAERKAGQK